MKSQQLVLFKETASGVQICSVPISLDDTDRWRKLTRILSFNYAFSMNAEKVTNPGQSPVAATLPLRARNDT
jgi:hypothetical protein